MTVLAVEKTKKVARHHRIIQLLLSGEPVAPATITAAFSDDPEWQELWLRRQSVYMWDVTNLEHGVVKVVKDGRKVASYQLENPGFFNDLGQWLGYDREMRAANGVTEYDSWGVDGPSEVPYAYLRDVKVVHAHVDAWAPDHLIGDDTTPWVDVNAVTVPKRDGQGRFVSPATTGEVALSRI